MKIVPDDRLAPQALSQFADGFGRDGFGHNFRPGPEDLDRRIEQFAKLLEIIGTSRRSGHSLAIGRRTKKQTGGRGLPAQEIEEVIGDPGLRGGGGVERPGVAVRKDRLNVIEQEGELAATEGQQLGGFPSQRRGLFFARISDIESGRDGINKTKALVAAFAHQVPQFARFSFGVARPPKRPVFEVVLRSVEVGVHPPGPHPGKELSPLPRRPGSSVEAFCHAAEERILGHKKTISPRRRWRRE